jgi:hypothetical protein
MFSGFMVATEKVLIGTKIEVGTKSGNDDWPKDVTRRNVQVDPAKQEHAETQHYHALGHPEPAVDLGKNAASNDATDNCSDPSWAHHEAGLQRGISKQKLQKHWHYRRCAEEDRANAEVQDKEAGASLLGASASAHFQSSLSLSTHHLLNSFLVFACSMS